MYLVAAVVVLIITVSLCAFFVSMSRGSYKNGCWTIYCGMGETILNIFGNYKFIQII